VLSRDFHQMLIYPEVQSKRREKRFWLRYVLVPGLTDDLMDLDEIY